MNEREELKPCPFDGGAPYFVTDEAQKICISCPTCFCVLGESADVRGNPDYLFRTKEEATIAWNTRTESRK